MRQQSGKERARTHPASLTGDVLDRLELGAVHLTAGLSLTYANKSAARLLRSQQDDLVGRALQDAVPGPFGVRLSEAALDAFEKQAAVSFEGYYPAPLDLRLEVCCIPAGEAVIAVFHDTTGKRRRDGGVEERKAPSGGSDETRGIPLERADAPTQQALLESGDKLRLARQAGHVGMFDWDMVAGVNELSDELKAMYVVSPDYVGTLDSRARDRRSRCFCPSWRRSVRTRGGNDAAEGASVRGCPAARLERAPLFPLFSPPCGYPGERTRDTDPDPGTVSGGLTLPGRGARVLRRDRHRARVQSLRGGTATGPHPPG